MNKAELIGAVSESTGLSKRDSGIVVNAFVDSVVDGILEDSKVSLARFGSFVVSARAARIVRNPQTGESFEVPAKRVLKFKPSSQIKDLINE